jgi:formyl-CoA transferase
VPCGPINTIDQTFADPQVQHLGMAAPVQGPNGEFNIVGSPINLEGTVKKIRSATPKAGEHTEEVLRSIGYSAADIEKLRANGVV